jgi:hypothetical protein
MLADPCAGDDLAGDDATHLIVIDGNADRITAPGSLPVVVCWVGERLGGVGPAAADLVVAPTDLADVVDAVERKPLAAVTLAVHLRASEGVRVDHALALESAAYSMLQHGPEFSTWRAATEGVMQHDLAPVVVMREDATLLVTLNRPHRSPPAFVTVCTTRWHSLSSTTRSDTSSSAVPGHRSAAAATSPNSAVVRTRYRLMPSASLGVQPGSCTGCGID